MLVTGETLIQGYSRIGNWLVWVVFVAMMVSAAFLHPVQISRCLANA